MEKEKDDVITDAGIDDIVSRIQNIRSQCPQSAAYKIIKGLEPLLEPYRIRLIDEYFSVVAAMEKDKKRLSKLKRQDYLKRLLTPLVKLNCLNPSGENPYLKHNATYPFIKETIWIDKEIDIKSLHYDKQRYCINFEYSKPLSYFDPDATNITIWDEYREYIDKKKKTDAEAKARGIKFIPITTIDAGKTSLRELYEKWLPALTGDKMKSKDLLDRMLVCFTIKRALNGDKDAIDKLYSIYENGAIGTAVNMAKKRKLNIEDIKDIKQQATMILRILISGSIPENIINSLSGRNGPLWVEKLYLWYLSDYVPKELDKIMKRPPGELDRVEIDYLLNPISIIDAYTLWQGTPERVMKFNSSSFRPNKNINLTIWLFGIGRGDMKGKFCQRISESIDACWKMKKEILYDFSDGNDDEESIEDFKTRKQVNKMNKPQQQSINDETIKKAINSLCTKGISKRDAEIFIKNGVQGYSPTDLAQEYDLSRKTIDRIIKKLSQKFFRPMSYF